MNLIIVEIDGEKEMRAFANEWKLEEIQLIFTYFCIHRFHFIGNEKQKKKGQMKEEKISFSTHEHNYKLLLLSVLECKH